MHQTYPEIYYSFFKGRFKKKGLLNNRDRNELDLNPEKQNIY
jgi:hypothetical protein